MTDEAKLALLQARLQLIRVRERLRLGDRMAADGAANAGIDEIDRVLAYDDERRRQGAVPS